MLKSVLSARQHSILHPERIVGSRVIRGMSGKSEHRRRNVIFSKHSSLRDLRPSSSGKRFKLYQFGWLRGAGQLLKFLGSRVRFEAFPTDIPPAAVAPYPKSTAREPLR
jgi:hypothetical protein